RRSHAGRRPIPTSPSCFPTYCSITRVCTSARSASGGARPGSRAFPSPAARPARDSSLLKPTANRDSRDREHCQHDARRLGCHIDATIEAVSLAAGAGREKQRIGRLILKTVAELHAPQAVDLDRTAVLVREYS